MKIKSLKKHLSVYALLFFSFLTSYAQSGFQEIFGGSDDESVFSLIQTLDGGFILTGNSQSYGLSNGLDNILLIKTDSLGTFQWARAYGDSLAENGSCVRQAADSSYWVTGRTYSNGSGSSDVFLLHTDPSGHLLFYKTFGDSLYEAGQSLELTTDGGCLITGGTYSTGNGDQDIFILKTDSTGQMQWLRIFGSTMFDQGTSLAILSSGGFLVGGRGIENGSMDILLTRFTDNGTLLWTKAYSGAYYDESYSVTESADYQYLISGSTTSFGNNNGFANFILIKTDTTGNILAAKTFGGAEADAAYSVYANRDSGFTVTGYSESYTGLAANPNTRGTDSANVFVIRVDAQLDTLWSCIYGGPSMDESFSVIQKNDNGFAVAAFEKSFGNDSSHAYLISMDPSGMSGCHQLYVKPEVLDVVPFTNNLFFTVYNSGFAFSSGSINTFTILAPDSFLCHPFFSGLEELQKSQTNLWPNPFSNEFSVSLPLNTENPNITIQIIDMTGKMVFSKALNKGSNKINGSFLEDGIYFYFIKDTREIKSVGKILKTGASK